MRFQLKPKPKNYDVRTITKFALLPVRVGLEVRWLEKVCIAQEYYVDWDDEYWLNTQFIDEIKE